MINNHCHRVTAQLQLNKYYYYYYRNLCADGRPIRFSRGDQSVPEGERARGFEGDDAATSTKAV
jgi:hypothetical protein